MLVLLSAKEAAAAEAEATTTTKQVNSVADQENKRQENELSLKYPLSGGHFPEVATHNWVESSCNNQDSSSSETPYSGDSDF